MIFNLVHTIDFNFSSEYYFWFHYMMIIILICHINTPYQSNVVATATNGRDEIGIKFQCKGD